MAKALIIAEKPSVAADLARALAKSPGMTAFSKEKDYFENETHVISSAVGHLLELKMPEVNGKKIGWGFTTLPIIPDEFELQPIESSADRYKMLQRLMKRKDIDSIVNACDAGREGELIFRYLIDSAGVKKPIQRMWMQSMTNNSILEAFKKLRTDEEMRPLADAAKCRSESDWIVGINGTRALTALNSRNGGFRLTPVGRVQTPTLTIMAKREKEIAAFVPRTYYEVHGLFGIESGRYNAYGPEMLRIKDRHDRFMLYGPTNEEMITDIFRSAFQSPNRGDGTRRDSPATDHFTDLGPLRVDSCGSDGHHALLAFGREEHASH